MKTTPTRKEIDEFMRIFKEEASDELVIGEEVTAFQIFAVEDHGMFLALVGAENYRNVARKLTTELKHYNLALGSLPSDTKKERYADLSKALKFKKTLLPPNWIKKHESDYKRPTDERYLELLRLIDQYIEDLQEDDYSKWKILPIERFSIPWKKSKTRLKKCIQSIIKDHKINGYTKAAKKLIDNLDNPPS